VLGMTLELEKKSHRAFGLMEGYHHNDHIIYKMLTISTQLGIVSNTGYKINGNSTLKHLFNCLIIMYSAQAFTLHIKPEVVVNLSFPNIE
jgi:hypothetical protein